jgi:hypothetical protein
MVRLHVVGCLGCGSQAGEQKKRGGKQELSHGVTFNAVGLQMLVLSEIDRRPESGFWILFENAFGGAKSFQLLQLSGMPRGARHSSLAETPLAILKVGKIRTVHFLFLKS